MQVSNRIKKHQQKAAELPVFTQSHVRHPYLTGSTAIRGVFHTRLHTRAHNLSLSLSLVSLYSFGKRFGCNERKPVACSI